MTDAQWRVLEPHARAVMDEMRRAAGRPMVHDLRAMVDAIGYVVRNGIEWRALPIDFPPWEAVYAFFQRWSERGLPQQLVHRLRGRLRTGLGREVQPSAAILDSQSVKAADTVGVGSRGFDSGKRINGRKRHLAVDVEGFLLAVVVTVTAAASYLKVKLATDRTSATFVPFVTALGALGLGMSVLIIGIVVNGMVGASTRRIGILKSLGFTPAQVARAYVAQARIPASVGAVLGVVCGNLLSIPVMSRADTAFDAGTLTLTPWIDLVVPAAALAAVAATALVPALRAGRLRTVEAIAVGHTPAGRRGRTVARMLGRLPLPRPMSLGLAIPFARPTRSATTAAAVAFGTAAVTFGVGLAVSLSGIQDAVNRNSAGAVVVQAFGPPAAPAPGAGTDTPARGPAVADPAAIAARIRAQPGTRRYFTTGQTRVSVAGLAGTTTVIVYDGDSSWGSYQMLNGSWFHRPGEAVVPSGFLTATGAHVGDTITLANNGHTTPVRIVGEAFALREEGMVILTDAASLTSLGAYVLPESVEFDIDLKPGADQQAYLDTLNAALQPLGVTAQPNHGQLSGNVVAMDALAAILTATLVAVAGLGVLNTVILETRERVHDLGILKALGMSPRQTAASVIASVTVVGALGDGIGVPIGAAIHHAVLPIIGHAGGARIPTADIAVYHPLVLIPLAAGGLAIALAGALVPAGWAARTRTAVALRTE